MADEKAPGDEIREKLLGLVDEVSEAINKAIDSNQLSEDDRKDLGELSRVLDKKINPRIQRQGDSGQEAQEPPLPDSKVKELDRLLPQIRRVLRRFKQPQPESSEPAVIRRKKMLSAAVTGCNPFSKLRSPLSQEKEEEGGRPREEDDDDDDEAVVSLKLLVRLAQQVLEPEQYYEWTTSYVDESRIYGWDEDAGEVVKALVGPNDGDFRFRAAAITGIHGSGKTALAQKVFVHDGVKDHFPLRLWVCVGPPEPDLEDRLNLLYRMLDNLGLDTNKVEDVIVHNAKVVQDKRKQEKDRILADEKEKAAVMEEARDIVAKEEEVKDGASKEEAGVEEDAAKKITEEKIKEEFEKLLEQKVENSLAVKRSKIGVLLYILHVTLSKTGYLIVFDDIRVYGDDGWYSNLTLPPPPENVEWSDRLAYGLPKTATKHRCAVLVTCRKEDDARAMVRTGRVFRPPKLEVDNGWRLFEREYKQAKEEDAKKKNNIADIQDNKEQADLLFKELEEMKKEIIKKCLGLPVAIIEAARGFALSGLDPLPEPDPRTEKKADQTGKDMQAADDKSAAQ